MKMFRVLLLALSLPAQAATTIEREFTCPLDQHRWTQRVEASGRAEALRLDSRQVGRDVVQPPTLPQCPQCRFVLFDAKFDDAAAHRLRAFVTSPDYRHLAAKGSPHACLAAIQELLAAPPVHIGFAYLRASWAAEGRDAQCRRLLALALREFTRALGETKPGGKDYINLALICGEIERRTGKWEEATARFTALRPVIAAGEPKYDAIVAQQLALIEKRNARPQIVGARPDAPSAAGSTTVKSGLPAGPRIALRAEPPPELPKPKTAAPSKVPDLTLPFIASGAGEDPVAVRPFVVKLPPAAGGDALPNRGDYDPAFADTPPPVELQPIPEGLPEAEPLPEPLPVNRQKTTLGKKNPKPKLKRAP
jgi:hypothetical protein